MSEYRVMHGGHLAFTLLRKMWPANAPNAKDVLWPDGHRPKTLERIRCGTCGHAFERYELAELIYLAQEPEKS